MTTRYFRQSSLSKFRRCRRSFEMEYVRNYLPISESEGQCLGARSLGHIVHKGVETHYTGGNFREVLDAEIGAKHLEETWSSEWADCYELAGIMLEGWEQWLAVTAADANEEVLFVEPDLEWEVGEFRGDLVVLTGHPDLVVHNTLNDLIIIDDTKTVTSFSQALIHGGQGLTYALMLKMIHGLDVGMFRTTQIKKVKRTARAKPPFYERSELFVNPQMLRTHWAQLQGQLDTMVEIVQRWEQEGDTDRVGYDKLVYHNPTKDCTWDCSYLAVCSSMDDGSNYQQLLDINYRPRPPKEEYVA